MILDTILPWFAADVIVGAPDTLIAFCGIARDRMFWLPDVAIPWAPGAGAREIMVGI